MAINMAKLNEIEGMLADDILTDEELPTRLHEAGLPELARVVGHLVRRQ